uniref:Uncharacterized protein n=1 Tax=Cacopsylla melanoneura TaxID=428564 RepID=A0A8D8R234_9HEMI
MMNVTQSFSRFLSILNNPRQSIIKQLDKLYFLFYSTSHLESVTFQSESRFSLDKLLHSLRSYLTPHFVSCPILPHSPLTQVVPVLPRKEINQKEKRTDKKRNFFSEKKNLRTIKIYPREGNRMENSRKIMFRFRPMFCSCFVQKYALHTLPFSRVIQDKQVTLFLNHL